MAKIRVHELAKELGIQSREMVNVLHGLGLDVKNHMSTMEESQVSWVKKQLANSKMEENKVPKSDKPKQPIDNRPSVDQGRQPHHRERNQNFSDPSKPPVDRNNRASSPDRADRPQNSGNRPPQSPNRPANRPQSPDRPGDRAQGPDRRPPSQYRPGNWPPSSDSTGNRPPSPDRPGNRPPSSDRTGNRPPSPNDNRGSNNHRPTNVNRNQDAGRPNTNKPASAGMNNHRPKDSNFRPPNARTPVANSAAPTSDKENLKASDVTRGAKPNKPNNKTKKTPDKSFPKKDYSRQVRKPKHKRKKEEVIEKTPDLIAIEDSITVREFAEMLGKSAAEIVKKLMELGTLATVNQDIDFETAEILASLYEVKVERAISEEEKLLEEIIDDDKSMELRPPIVTVMGHVDHGKTSLLDKIRSADVVSGEAGGITQHIGAYQVTVKGNKITFIDTPGHEAFTAMRARGANLTDIVILVIAADDGVMPQTVEAINHIKAAGVPFLVAVNKVDKPTANPDKVMQQLTEYGIVPEEWGGDIIFVPVSAKTGDNIDTLLEMVLLVAELNEIKANSNRAAEGVVIEAELDKGRGPVATVLVLKGTLKVGDFLICGSSLCKVRAMSDYRGRRVDNALPSMPIEIMGWSDVPEAGGKVQACDEKIAKEVLSLRASERKLEEQKSSSKVSLDDFFKQMQDAGVKELNLIIKGDVQGSIEALAQSLLRLSTDEVKVNVIHSAVGAVTETDVMLATASNAIIIGFNVRPDVNARKSAEQENIDVRLYRVIYEAIDDVKKAMVGLLDPEYKEKYIGRAEVRATFKVPNAGTIAGSYIIDGKMQRNANIRVLRDGVIIYEGNLSSLKRFKDDVKEVQENYECGIGIKDFNDLKDGDVIEAFTMEEIPREL